MKQILQNLKTGEVEIAGFELERLYTHVGLPLFPKIGIGELIFCIARKQKNRRRSV